MSDSTKWDRSYEWKAVALLGLGFGLVGIDRFMIMPLFPVIMHDLHLDYQDLGYITGALSVGWGISAIIMGNLSDRIGHRKVIIPAVIVFSLLAGISGLAAGVLSLCLVRLMMGLFEGSYTPASVTATIDASKPTRHGLNVGIQQALCPFLGMAITPIVVTQLLKVMPWHLIFAVVSIPGLVVAFLLYRVLRNTKTSAAAMHTTTHDASPHRWKEVFGYWNVPFNVCGMFCWLTVLVVIGAFFPSFLIEYRHLDMQQMGFVLSSLGFGSTVGTVVIPAISDRIGRKISMMLSVACAGVFIVLLDRAGAEPTMLFFYLFMLSLFLFGMISLTVGPISSESVPAALMSSATGLVMGGGEIFGGAAAPAIAGYVAKNYGIQYPMYVAMGALVIGFVITCFLRETLPKKSFRLAQA